VQVVNRVTWDNIIIPTDRAELGWKDTVRISPLQDTIVALRPIIPEVPWELPNAIRPLNPMMPLGSMAMFNNIDPQGNPTAQIVNQLVNFGWEYVYHCHILSHEEMDMMRPVSIALPPVRPDGLAATVSSAGGSLAVDVSWNDNSIAETAYLLQKSEDGGATWLDLATIDSPLDQANLTGPRLYTDSAVQAGLTYQYRVIAKNSVGYGAEFPMVTVQSMSDVASITTPVQPAAPTGLAAQLQFGPMVNLTWSDNADNETAFVVERSDNGGAFVAFPDLAADTISYLDTSVQPGHTYRYQVYAKNLAGGSALSNLVTVIIPAAPAAPTNLVLTVQGALPPTGPRIRVVFRDNQNGGNPETGFLLYRSENGGPFNLLATLPPRAGVGNIPAYFDYAVTAGSTYAYYAVTVNASSASAPSNTASATLPPAPLAPSSFLASTQATGATTARVNMIWTDNSNNETRFVIQRATDANFTANLFTSNRGSNTTAWANTGLPRNTDFYYRIRAENTFGVSVWVNLTPFPIHTP
jgi:hypothetical protein